MGELTSYLRLGRAQTAPLETVPAVVAVILAGGSYTAMLLWGLYGALYHFAGYSMNSYSDWRNGYDKSDPNKQHHPLNNGELSPLEAKTATVTLFIIAILYATVLCLYYLSIGGLIVVYSGVLAGVAYNELGKKTLAKPLLISLAHGTVFLAPYVAVMGGVDWVGWLGFVAVFVWVFYQIAISGEIKDLDTDEENILLHFGAKYNEWWNHSNSVMSEAVDRQIYMTLQLRIFGASIRTVYTFLLFFGAILLGISPFWSTVIGLIGVSTVVLNTRLTQSGPYERGRRLRTMSLIEIGSFSMFAMLTLSVAPAIVPVLLISLSAVYLLVCNKVLWGTLIAPEV